tara:strand:+ start:1343 stop:2239 length:897 start_codon:yes stop_codon:yes gene_type:complete
MRKSDFLDYLEKPKKLGQSELSGISELNQAFPYFQTGHFLLSKVYQNTDNLGFERQLKLSAAYAIDRKALHSLVIEESKPEKKITTSEENTSAIKEEKVEKEVSKEYHEFQDEQETDSTKKESKVASDDAQLEKQILSGAINSSILLEVDDEIPEIDSLMPKKQKTQEQKIEQPKPIKNDFNENETHSFSDWLSHYKIEGTQEEEEDEWDDFYEQDTDFHENNSLPVRHEFYSAAKMARLSVQENDDLITETLAKIYEDQAHFEKALNAYKKLQLKYPEKSSYFAGRIIAIQNKLNTL